MDFAQSEFEALLLNPTKQVEGDISWAEDEDHSPAVEFRAEVRSDVGYPLHLIGRYNLVAKTLSFGLVYRQVGSVYRLDLGKDHQNPDSSRVGRKHKHKYREGYADKWAYQPPDITAEIDDVPLVWRQFCAEASIVHTGDIAKPPAYQAQLFL
jgi:hypothetical protein